MFYVFLYIIAISHHPVNSSQLENVFVRISVSKPGNLIRHSACGFQ